MRRRMTGMRRQAFPVMLAVGLALGCAGLADTADANEFRPQLERDFSALVQPMLTDSDLVTALKAVPAPDDPSGLSAREGVWQAELEAGTGPMTTAATTGALAERLKALADTAGIKLDRLVVLGPPGEVLATTKLDPDYWRGDEDALSPVRAGSADPAVEDVVYDSARRIFTANVSAPVVDPASGALLGVLTATFNIENLL